MNNDSNGGFTINVNSPGNLIAQTINFNAPVTFGGKTEHGGFSDQQIARALEACVGRERVINTKWKWAGAYWYLRWACNYPVDIREFCEKIENMNLNIDAKYKCDYNNIRRFCTLSFIDYNPLKMDNVKFSKNDASAFADCRAIALKLAEEIGKTYLPNI
jgi:hypothetical protein